jgi:hypothetical protein
LTNSRLKCQIFVSVHMSGTKRAAQQVWLMCPDESKVQRQINVGALRRGNDHLWSITENETRGPRTPALDLISRCDS